MATAYHMEALRKQRGLEKKMEALQRLLEATQAQPLTKDGFLTKAKGTGSVNSVKVKSQSQPKSQNSNENIVFEEVFHDPNFQYRILCGTKEAPVHVDPIYRIMYPGAIRHVHKSQLGDFLKKHN